MFSTGFSSSFFLLTFPLLLQTVFGQNPIFYYCSNSKNFTANGTYETNTNKLMGYLYCNAPPTGFGLGSLGQNPNQANGLALCRGDVSTTDCKTCIVQASNELPNLCPYNESTAFAYYDNCSLKYSNEDFFGQIDNSTTFYMWNTQNVSDPGTFNQKVNELLSQLVKEASVTTKMYAAGDAELDESTTIYGLAQCTRDLSSSDCKTCLDGLIGDLPSCCDGKQGGRVVDGSCNIRYEIYQFFNA